MGADCAFSGLGQLGLPCLPLSQASWGDGKLAFFFITGADMLPFKWMPLIFVTTSLLLACGGGGGGADSSEDDTAVTWSNNPAGAATFSGVSAAYQGAITGLGSIIVNGVRFETTDALVYDSDDFSAGYNSSTSTFSSPLALGMTVALFGDVDDAQSLGRAARIRVVGGVRGTMSAVDTSALTLTLPTQTIALSSSTTYGGTSDGTATGTPITNLTQLAALSGNPLLTVYGLPQSDGRFLATRVVVTHASAHTMDVAVRGTITVISGNSYTVKTDANASMTVNCSGTCTIQPSGATPAVGDPVRALATDINQWSGATLTASRLQLVNASYLTSFQGAPSTASYAKIKGVAVSDGGLWKVGGVVVRGVTLTAGTVYEIKGTWSGTELVATRVEVEGQRSFTDGAGSNRTYSSEFYGAVSNLRGLTFSVQGVNVVANSAYFPDGSAGLSNGAFVEVKGNYVNGTLVATKVEIKAVSASNPSAGRVFEMYGQVSGWTGVGGAFNLTRQGVVYSAQSSVDTRFEHAAPVNGSYVQAKGYMDANHVFQVIKLEVKNGYTDHDD
jgi:hypothetical protein